MKIFVNFLILSVVTVALAACNYTHLKDGLNSNQDFGKLNQREKLSMMNYQFISSRILEPKCVGCHRESKEVKLEKYENVIFQLEAIKKSVFVEQTMPKRGSLTADEKRWLWNWILMGGPRNSEEVPPEDEPLVPTYDSITKHIFEPKCIPCHNPSDTGKRILLDKESLLNSPLELVIPGNVEESGLVISVERSDDKRMPPDKEGYTALTDKEKEAIRKWIINGAKD